MPKQIPVRYLLDLYTTIMETRLSDNELPKKVQGTVARLRKRGWTIEPPDYETGRIDNKGY